LHAFDDLIERHLLAAMECVRGVAPRAAQRAAGETNERAGQARPGALALNGMEDFRDAQEIAVAVGLLTHGTTRLVRPSGRTGTGTANRAARRRPRTAGSRGAPPCGASGTGTTPLRMVHTRGGCTPDRSTGCAGRAGSRTASGTPS